MSSELIDIKAAGSTGKSTIIEFGFGWGLLNFVIGAIEHELSESDKEIITSSIASYLNRFSYWEKIGPVPVFYRRINPAHVEDEKVITVSKSIVESAIHYRLQLLGSFSLEHQSDFCRGIEWACKAIVHGEDFCAPNVPKLDQNFA